MGLFMADILIGRSRKSADLTDNINGCPVAVTAPVSHVNGPACMIKGLVYGRNKWNAATATKWFFFPNIARQNVYCYKGIFQALLHVFSFAFCTQHDINPINLSLLPPFAIITNPEASFLFLLVEQRHLPVFLL